jgi:adenylate cyclase
MNSEKSSGKQFRIWLRRVIFAAIGTACWVFGLNTIPGQSFEFAINSMLVRQRGALPSPEDVAVVAMDESSYQALNLPMDRPLPRSVHAALIKRLGELGAARVVFDVIFVGRSASPEGDAALEEALSAAPVVLGVEFGSSVSAAGTKSYEVFKPDPFLARKATALATTTMNTDEGVVRYFYKPNHPLVVNYTSLSEAGAGIYTPAHREGRNLPAGSDLITFYGPARTIKTYPLYQILETEVPFPAHLIKGKVIFVGLSLRTGLGAQQKDSFQTPFGDVFGVEIHATQATNLMNGSWTRHPPMREQILLGGSLCFLVCLLAVSLKPVSALTFTALLALAWFAAALAAIHYQVFLAGASIVTIVVPILCLVNTLYHYIRTRRKQKQIEGAFACYLSPAMVTQLKRNPGLLKLGGEELVCSAIFTDIKGFTTISETLGPMRVVSMLNAYFSDVSDAVTNEGGTVIKFIGDAVFAIWGAPLAQEDHAMRAVRAALKIQSVVDEFNKRGEYPLLVTRVGVNTGKMVVGNLGSSSRFDYTAIGDSVNLAARVEGVNKYLGTTVLVTEDAYTELGINDFHFLRMGAIRVVGKEIPIKLYRLSVGAVPPEMRQVWERALDTFASRDWDAAQTAFARVKEVAPELAVASDTYLEAIRSFKEEPPTVSWQGELVMDHK